VIAKLKANGVLGLLAALLLWGLWAFLPKMAMQSNMQPHSVIFYEALGGLLVAVPLMFSIKPKNLVRDQKGIGIVFCGALISTVAILFYYKALQMGHVATVSTIAAMYPLVVMLLARVVLKEKMNRTQLLAAAMAMVAIYLLAG